MRLHPGFFAGILGLVLVTTHAAGVQLTSHNPFERAPSDAPVVAPPVSLEYVGYVDVAGRRCHRVYDVAVKRGVWVQLQEGEDESGIMAKGFEANPAALTVERQGRVHRLPLRETRVVSRPGNARAAMTPQNTLDATAEQIRIRRESRGLGTPVASPAQR